MLKHLIPTIFYEKLDQGLALFVSCLGFEVLYQDSGLAVIQRDGAKAYLMESPEFAAEHRPQITIETDTIDALYLEISTNHPEILHPNNRTISRKPWGAREFAVLDQTTVCIVFRQFD